MTNRILVGAALLFWGWYWIVQQLLGPFGADDTFFLHIFWMLRQGMVQYQDFYSYHLPAYFWLVRPLLPSGDGLEFAWWFRALSLVVVGCYALMVRPALWPFLLIFAVFGGIGALRPDTLGLLLFNVAWFLLLKDRKHLALAGGLASLAILFSARAGIMMVGMTGLLLWLARSDRRQLIALLATGTMFVAAIGIYALLDPARFELIIRSVFVDTIGIFPRMPLAARFLEIERIALVAMILAALGGAIIRRVPVIIAACSFQLLLIVVDPLPFGYVYGWATIPTLAGLGLIPGIAWGAFGSAVAMLALTISYPIRKGTPGVGHYARLTLDRPISAAALVDVPTPKLVKLMMAPSGPWNQLAVREEVCRRFPGKAVTHFWYQPICLNDAMYNWIGQTTTAADLARAITRDPPQLIIWGEKSPPPTKLLTRYSVYSGFAIRER